MLNFDLNDGGKIRIWFDSLIALKINPIETLRKEYTLEHKKTPINNFLITELFLPRGGRIIYGLLGLEYKQYNTNNLQVKIPITTLTNHHKIFKESLMGSFDPPHVTLLKEYSTTILNSLDNLVNEDKLNIYGELNFSYAACSEVSSNEWIFSKLTNILVKLLFIHEKEIDKEIIINSLD